MKRSARSPLHAQLYDELRHAILSGRLGARARLPATRSLAESLRVSRNTVSAAFDQLMAEGYLEARVGSGTRVSSALPEQMLRAMQPAVAPPSSPRQSSRLSRRGAAFAGTDAILDWQAFAARPFQWGMPAIDAFPFPLMAHLVARRWRAPGHDLLAYGPPAGYRPLRRAIAEHVRQARGVQCEPDQVIVVAASEQGFALAAQVLLDPGDPVWVEDPGYSGAREVLRAAGAQLVAVPLDEDGLDVAAGKRKRPRARLACVSPSHQFPLGITMSLARRLALLEWANRADAWVLENDYDSEFRYIGRPLPALHGLDPHNRVIYLGTFSKVLLPCLRLAYLVVPPDLLDAFTAAAAAADQYPPSLTQAFVADFMTEGHFARHLRRMRGVYAERRQALVQAAARDLGGLLEITVTETGMHILGWLPDRVNDWDAARWAAREGVTVQPMSPFRIRATGRPGLILAYGAVKPAGIRDGVRRLAKALRQAQA